MPPAESSTPAPTTAAKPEPRPIAALAQTLETTDPALRDSIFLATVNPTVDTLRAVSADYARLRVFDKALVYIDRAIVMSPEHPGLLDSRARLWRDAGFPHLGLPDAYRAVYFAPQSPIARNTLGTLLQALGKRTLATSEYEKALQLDPRAAYALNNLCYTQLLDGASARAIETCERAIAIDPSFTAARNNLALAHATAGDHHAARQALAHTDDRAAELYNAGIVHMALGEYRSAVDAFAAAHVLRPTMSQALVRAKQAATLALNSEE